MIDLEKFDKMFEKFLEVCGQDFQMRMCVEEMSELTKEICKYERIKNLKEEDMNAQLEKAKQNIIEETADVLICAMQMRKMFGEDEVDKVMNYKIDRGYRRTNEYIEKQKMGENNGKSSNKKTA